MLVKREDATCRECYDSYKVEPDGFGDGCVEYYIPYSVQTAEEWDEAEELQGGV